MLVPSGSHHNTQGEARREAERFIQSALDALSAHIAILDENGVILGVNEAWQRFAVENGYRHDAQGVGVNYLEVCDKAVARRSPDAAIVARGIRDIMNARLSEFEMEYACHSPLARRWFTVRVSRFFWYGRTRFIVAHQNITELKQAQFELARNHRRTEAIIENVNNGIVTVDVNGTILTANRACARIFACQAGDLVGKSLSDVLDEPFQGKETFRKLNGVLGHELLARRADGTTFPIYFALNEVRMEEGSVYTCIIQDITWQKQSEQERLERERMALALEKERELRDLRNRFLSMMSHELRTPIASISLSYDMLKRYANVSTPEERMQALDNIRAQVELLSEMVSDVMTLSRSEMEGFQISRQYGDLVLYCRDIVEEFQFNYHEHYTLEFESAVEALRVPFDRKLLRRAITNLLSNALKYSPRGSQVTLRLAPEGKAWAVIEVRDNGIGIPEADQAKLFEPFHRASNVDNVAGTGLGLPITKQIVELHGGKVGFVSTLGVGTTFTVRLPLDVE